MYGHGTNMLALVTTYRRLRGVSNNNNNKSTSKYV